MSFQFVRMDPEHWSISCRSSCFLSAWVLHRALTQDYSPSPTYRAPGWAFRHWEKTNSHELPSYTSLTVVASSHLHLSSSCCLLRQHILSVHWREHLLSLFPVKIMVCVGPFIVFEFTDEPNTPLHVLSLWYVPWDRELMFFHQFILQSSEQCLDLSQQIWTRRMSMRGKEDSSVHKLFSL